MPQSLEVMVARWPLLYPEIAGADEADDDRNSETVTVRREVIAPLLEAADIHSAFEVMSEEYRKWRSSLPTEEEDLETVLAHEDENDDALTATFGVYSEELGEAIIKAVMEGIRLRRIVRRSILPQREGWPEESWERIGHLMTNSELCLAGILEYLATEEGSRANVETLARWGFENALEAYWDYWDAGYYGRDYVKLEDIPE